MSVDTEKPAVAFRNNVSPKTNPDEAETDQKEKPGANGQQQNPKRPSLEQQKKISESRNRRISLGKLLYPGQGGFNPCLCFIFFCGGTCTLQYGCVILALFQIFFGFVGCIFSTMLAVFSSSPPLFRYPLDSPHTDGTLKDDLWFHFLSFYIFQAANCLVFWFGAGILFAYSASKLHRFFLLIYNGMMAFSIIYLIITTCLSTVVINSHVHFPAAFTDQAHARNALYSRVWIVFCLSCMIQVYFFACGLALLFQIRNGEYWRPIPPPRGGSNGSGRPMLPKPPLVNPPGGINNNNPDGEAKK